MTALPVNNWKTISVSSQYVCSATWHTPLHSQKWSKWFLCPNRLAPKGWLKFWFYHTSEGIFRLFPFGGNRRLSLALISGNPDEGALNEVSSLANEKFISSRNKYGAKRKAVLVSGKPNSQVYLATHKINGSTPRKSATGESPGKTDSWTKQ